ncbi:MAG: hypothetical protein OXH37_09560, partial [Gammaproteobacteria bacterium]|nr:hypothetical protein [Gammaproteobacteria bacterium]
CSAGLDRRVHVGSAESEREREETRPDTPPGGPEPETTPPEDPEPETTPPDDPQPETTPVQKVRPAVSVSVAITTKTELKRGAWVEFQRRIFRFQRQLFSVSERG